MKIAREEIFESVAASRSDAADWVETFRVGAKVR